LASAGFNPRTEASAPSDSAPSDEGCEAGAARGARAGGSGLTTGKGRKPRPRRVVATATHTRRRKVSRVRAFAAGVMAASEAYTLSTTRSTTKTAAKVWQWLGVSVICCAACIIMNSIRLAGLRVGALQSNVRSSAPGTPPGTFTSASLSR